MLSTDIELETLDLPKAKVGQNYKATLKAKGGKEPYLWGASPRIANGLVVSKEGEITGKPILAELTTIAIVCQDAHVPERSAQRQYTITVED